jgi:hypothetical protein
MPLPDDARIVTLANDLVQQLQQIFGEHPGFRPAHAKGAMFTGTFTLAPGATSLTKAPHMSRPSTPSGFAIRQPPFSSARHSPAHAEGSAANEKVAGSIPVSRFETSMGYARRRNPFSFPTAGFADDRCRTVM